MGCVPTQQPSTSGFSHRLFPGNMSNRIALILGSGAGVGAHVASRLRSEGYRVATVSRASNDAENNGNTMLTLEGDLADPFGVSCPGGERFVVRMQLGEPFQTDLERVLHGDQTFGVPQLRGGRRSVRRSVGVAHRRSRRTRGRSRWPAFRTGCT